MADESLIGKIEAINSPHDDNYILRSDALAVAREHESHSKGPNSQSKAAPLPSDSFSDALIQKLNEAKLAEVSFGSSVERYNEGIDTAIEIIGEHQTSEIRVSDEEVMTCIARAIWRDRGGLGSVFDETKADETGAGGEVDKAICISAAKAAIIAYEALKREAVDLNQGQLEIVGASIMAAQKEFHAMAALPHYACHIGLASVKAVLRFADIVRKSNNQIEGGAS